MLDMFKNYWSELQVERAKVGRLEHTISELESRVEYQTKVNMDLYLDIVANGEELDFARVEIHDTRETLADTQEELEVYRDMQENLNANLVDYPHILDALETLQDSTVPLADLGLPFDTGREEQLRVDLAASEMRVAYYIQGLKRCHSAYLAVVTEAQDYKHHRDKWQTAYNKLQSIH